MKEFERIAEPGVLVPVSRELVADMETPLSAFRKVAGEDWAFLLESVEGGEKWGRYSFMGGWPRAVYRWDARGVEVRDGQGEVLEVGSGDPLEVLDRFLQLYRAPSLPELPRFWGGAVGYLGYDAVRYLEALGEGPPRSTDFPEALFIIPEVVVVFDNLRHTMRIVASAPGGGPAKSAYDGAVSRIEEVIERLNRPTVEPLLYPSDPAGPAVFTPALPKEAFCKAVEKVREEIRRGEAIQVVLSQRLTGQVKIDPFLVYRALRGLNPSPYMYYLRFGSHCLVGSSPEILVRVTEDRIELRPIAGTRPRGTDETEDRRLEEELLADEKERAEHLMLVDLGRNDLGRVAEVGTVRVEELMLIERYSHVMHIVSHLSGRRRPGLSELEILKACFPAGTVTGAPKVRAMQFIDELEPVSRGPYAGAVGYFGLGGSMDTCIAIRTLAFQGGDVTLQVGAGIVADSVPDREYEETMRKAEALIRAVEIALAWRTVDQ